jgi:hypothetical protein
VKIKLKIKKHNLLRLQENTSKYIEVEDIKDIDENNIELSTYVNIHYIEDLIDYMYHIGHLDGISYAYENRIRINF